MTASEMRISDWSSDVCSSDLKPHVSGSHPHIQPGYRPCVGLLLLNRQGRVFVGRRVDTADAWQMPQGGIDPDEEPRVAALREMREEIGTASAAFLAESRVWRPYDLPPSLARRIWAGRDRGQAPNKTGRA